MQFFLTLDSNSTSDFKNKTLHNTKIFATTVYYKYNRFIFLNLLGCGGDPKKSREHRYKLRGKTIRRVLRKYGITNQGIAMEEITEDFLKIKHLTWFNR